jgi:LPXTG-motif cell wall-anchored protein
VAGGSGGSGGGLPVTGANVWWTAGAGLMLLIGGAVAYRALRPRRVRVVSE